MTMTSNISNRAWGGFSAADYTPEQYARACLINLNPPGKGDKALMKLPVREPDGTLNRNAIHAAAAALAGARGGVDAPAAAKRAAARALAGMYRAMGEPVPASIRQMIGE